MIKLIMWNVMTLDGYFNGVEDWQLDFHNYVWGEELEQFSLYQLNNMGGLIFGRITFEGMANYWTNDTTEIGQHMREIPKFVFSNTLDNLNSFSWNNSELVKGDLVKEVSQLKETMEKDIFIFGSAKLANELAKNNLIDEYRICITPVLLGKGQPLFKPKDVETRLELIESRSVKTGGIILYYRPLNSQ